MPSRLMPLTLLTILAVAVMWLTRGPQQRDGTGGLPVLTADEILALQGDHRALLLNFWATWCEPCEKEMPDFVNLHKKWAPQGLKVILVNLESPDQADLAQAFLNRFQASELGAIRAPQENFFQGLGLEAPSALPYTALLGRKSGPIFTETGLVDFQELELEIKGLFE